MLGWQEVYLTFFLNDYLTAREALERSGIPYRSKVRDEEELCQSHLGADDAGGAFSTEYFVYVRKSDTESARRLINRALHG